MFPFTVPELTGILRRYLAEPNLKILELQPASLSLRPAAGLVRGLQVVLERAGHREEYVYIVKQPATLARAEINFYQSLAGQLNLKSPELVGADTSAQWFLIEPYVTEVPAEKWTAADYQQAVINLARLHDRFWGLHEDLAVYNWLAQPLAKDFEQTVLAATKAFQSVLARSAPPIVTGSLSKTAYIGHILSHADQLAQYLRTAPQTLLHGDYWAGNISLDEDRAQIVYDWQTVSLGPGVLDLVTFINTNLLWLSRLPLEPAKLIELYRAELKTLGHDLGNETTWQQLWNVALLWRFLQVGLPTLAEQQLSPAQLQRFNQLWLEPVLHATRQFWAHENFLKVEKLDTLLNDSA